MVVFDTGYLIRLLDPAADPPNDPETGQPVEHCQERIEYLLERLEEDNQTILIPTPALAELLVIEPQLGPSHLTYINSRSVFQIQPFDERAAVEVAAMTRNDDDNPDNENSEPKTKVKYDRQIIAVGKVNQGKVIYSADQRLRRRARREGLTAIGIHELPRRPQDAQQTLDLPDPEGEQETE